MEPYIGEIRLFAFGYAPKGWAFCDGQLMSVAQNSPLFAVLGTQYGGDGTKTFALPDLRGRAALGASDHFRPGELVGAATHEPGSHSPQAFAGVPDVQRDVPQDVASAGQHAAAGATATLAPPPTEHRQPYLALNYAIALNGVFPPRP